MKLKGQIREQPVVVLIDGGATHNFIASKLVQQLGLPRTETVGHGVIMGTRMVSARGGNLQRSEANP